MTIDTSKLVAYLSSGDVTGLNTSKIVAYVLVEVGTEGGAPAVAHRRFAYRQVLRRAA